MRKEKRTNTLELSGERPGKERRKQKGENDYEPKSKHSLAT
jgi:hypothetical protein